MNPKITSGIVLAITLLYGNVTQGQRNAAPNTPIDETLFTNYFFGAAQSTATWITCGSTENTSGCYASGILGPFGKIGAMMEGYPRTNVSTNTVIGSSKLDIKASRFFSPSKW